MQTTEMYQQVSMKVEMLIANIDLMRGIMRVEPQQDYERSLRALLTVIKKHEPMEYQIPAKFRGGEKGIMDTFLRCKACHVTPNCPEIIDIAMQWGIK